jgi:hypothetical protein
MCLHVDSLTNLNNASKKNIFDLRYLMSNFTKHQLSLPFSLYTRTHTHMRAHTHNFACFDVQNLCSFFYIINQYFSLNLKPKR